MTNLDSFINVNGRKDIQSIANVEEYYQGSDDLYNEIGPHFKTPISYIYEFQLRNPQVKITCSGEQKKLNYTSNKNEPVHRWINYIEGFSKVFVINTIKKFNLSKKKFVLDPFAGSGTVNVCAKSLGIPSLGIEINPTVYRWLQTKCCWNISPKKIIAKHKEMNFSDKVETEPPEFLNSERQFLPQVLENLLRIKEQVDKIDEEEIKQFFDLAFASILLPCSNLKRSPSLGYDKKKTKKIHKNLPFDLFNHKVNQIIHDLKFVHSNYMINTFFTAFNKDSKEFCIPKECKIDAVITSPPYLNSFDYPGNYKLEMGWMGDAESTKDLRELRDNMILCDNVSRTMIKNYSQKRKIFENEWLDYISAAVKPRMKERAGIRRTDYPILLHKYFDDIYKVLQNTYEAMNKGGKVAWVVGDSLVIDVYIPTDLLTLSIAQQIGFKLKGIDIARVRRSGVRRNFKLRESILYFNKE